MKRTWKTLVSLGLTAILTCSILAGCGGGGDGGSNGGNDGGNVSGTTSSNGYDLVFWTYSDMVLNDQGKLMDQWVKEFCEENDDVNSITVVAKDDSDLLTSLMAGVGLPDMFCASARDALSFQRAIDLLDISYIYLLDKDWADGFYEGARSAVTNDAGKQYAVPFMSFVSLIFRNTDVLEKAGIDWKNEPLSTWEDFYDQCKRVNTAGIDATHSWSTGHFTCPGGILACDAPNLTIGHKDGKTTVEASQCVRAFETICKMDEFSNGMTYASQAATEAFKTGELAFLCAGPWTEPDYQQAGMNYDIQLIPAYEDGGWTGGCQGQDWMYGIDSGDAGRNDAIGRWLKKMGAYDTQKAFTRVIGRSTLREDVMNDPEALELDVAKVLSKGMNAGMPQMEFGHSSVFWVSAITDIAPRVSSGELTPEEGAEAFIKAVNALYAEAGE